MRCLFTCLLVMVFGACLAGAQQAPWWNNARLSSKTRIYRADSIMMHYRKTNPDSALFYAQIMLKLARQANDSGSVDYGLVSLGSLHRLKGQLDSSVYYYTLALASYKRQKFDEGIASIYNNLATVYKIRSRYDLAIKNYHEALGLLKNTRRYNALANLYSNFAGLYYQLENNDRALELWTISKPLYLKDSLKKHEVSHALRGMGRVYLRQHKTAEAIRAFNEALALDRKNGIGIFIPDDLLLLLEVYSAQGNSEKMQALMQQLRPLVKQNDIPATRGAYHEFAGDLAALQKNYARAVLCYDSSLVDLNIYDMPENRLRVLEKRFAARLGTGKVAGLEQEWEAIQALEKNVAQLRQDRMTQETDARYNLRDKETLIQALNERNRATHRVAVQEHELRKQSRRQVYFLWGGILLVCAFALYILLTNRKLKRTQKELEKNIRQKDFLFRELNHRVKNNLHIVSSFLGIEMHGKPNDVQEILRTCENRIHSLGLVHEMLYNSEKLEKVELNPYFTRLGQSVLQTLGNHNSRLDIEVEKNIWLSPEKAILVGLIVNELLTNAIKHARPDSGLLQMNINARSAQNRVTVELKDNGRGLPAEENRGKGSMGMKLAYGLAEQAGGRLSWQNLDRGAAFTLVFTSA